MLLLFYPLSRVSALHSGAGYVSRPRVVSTRTIVPFDFGALAPSRTLSVCPRENVRCSFSACTVTLTVQLCVCIVSSYPEI